MRKRRREEDDVELIGAVCFRLSLCSKRIQQRRACCSVARRWMLINLREIGAGVWLCPADDASRRVHPARAV